MKLDYQRLARYILLANLIVTGLVVYVGWDFMRTEAAPADTGALFAPIKPAKKTEPQRKGMFEDYSIITADKFLPGPDIAPGQPTGLLPIPGPSSALDRLLKVRGTAVSSEKTLSFAIVELLQSREFRTVKAGDEIAGAKVLDIAEDSVLVSMENEEVTLYLNATEEYGGKTKRRVPGDRGERKPGQLKRPGTVRGSADKIPPQIQEQLKNLPPEMRKRWEQASPEEKRKYIKKFMERAREQGGREGMQQPRRDPRRRR